jgi:threonine dehydrogenase-like Zn-dependent dehydrogenase
MRAVVFDSGLRSVTNHPEPEPAAGEAIVRVLVAGICKTDLEITKGYMGFRGVPGHEFVGVVERVEGAGGQALVGRRVVGEINCGCGRCGFCVRGLKGHCPGRTVLGIHGRDGAMADYLSLPTGNLLEVPEGVPDEEAVFTEPLAAAFEVLEQVHVRPTERVLVMGDGKLGILAALALNLTGASVTLLGKHERKLAIARAQGVGAVLLRDLKKSRDYDVVVEATGSAGGLEAAVQLVKPRGTVVLKTTVEESKVVDLTPLVVDEVTVVGSRCGPFAPALKAISERGVDVRPLVTGVFGFDRADEAFRLAVEKGSMKVLLDFRG